MDKYVQLIKDERDVYRVIENLRINWSLKNISNLLVWKDTRSIKFEPYKCQLIELLQTPNITFSVIESVSHAKNLGVAIYKEHSWPMYISNICNKTNSTLNVLIRKFRTCSPSVKSKLFLSYLRSP